MHDSNSELYLETTEVNQPTAILTTDWHLRDTVPACRTDDYLSAQWNKVAFIRELQEKYECPVLMAGDLFHVCNRSMGLLCQCMNELPQQMICIPGQHDMPRHRMDLLADSAYGVLEESRRINKTGVKGFWLDWFPYGTELRPNCTKTVPRIPKVAIVHKLTWYGKKPYPGAPDTGNALSIMKQLAGYDLILTGDNHEQFTLRFGDQLLVNPGSLMRMTSAQMEHEPAVYLWSAEDNTVERVVIPHESGVVIKREAQFPEGNCAVRGDLDAFLNTVTEEFETDLDFKKTLLSLMDAKEVEPRIRQIIEESINE